MTILFIIIYIMIAKIDVHIYGPT